MAQHERYREDQIHASMTASLKSFNPGISNCTLRRLIGNVQTKPALVQNRFYINGFDGRAVSSVVRMPSYTQAFWILSANPRLM